MSERSERTVVTDGGAGDGQNGSVQPQADRASEAERAAVIAPPVEPVHGRPTEPAAGGGGEQAKPNGPPTQDVPPWQRGGAARLEQSTLSIDVGQPRHGTSTRDAAPSAPYAFSDGPAPGMVDAPTGYVEPVDDPPASDRPFDDAEYDHATVRTEQPVFEHDGPSAYRASTPSTRVRSGRVPRRASLELKRLDPWSVLKLSLVLSVAGFLAWMVAVGVLYGVLEGMGVWNQINGTYSDLTSVSDPQGGELISAGRVFGIAAVVGTINIVLLTALATIGAFLYNVSSDLAGGIELTLSERD